MALSSFFVLSGRVIVKARGHLLSSFAGREVVRAELPRIFAIYLATTLLASYLTYRYFEAPAQNLVRELFLRPKAAARQPVMGIPK
jgi:peptidoglycan/LPS O-acetylase OafA/YrhL